MNNLIVLVRAVLDVVVAAVSLPEDWNDETAVEAWLDGMNAPLAKVIALLTPDDELPTGVRQGFVLSQTLRAMGDLVDKVYGKRAADMDWKLVVDWVVDLLVSIFPAYEGMLRLVAVVLKQLIDLLMIEADKLGPTDKATLKALMAA